MSNHPPLCPRTRLCFCLRGVFIGRGHTLFYEGFDSDRELLARYQSCAWLDRADKYEAIMGRIEKRFKFGWTKHWYRKAYKRQLECFEVSRAWRRWEKITNA